MTTSTSSSLFIGLLAIVVAVVMASVIPVPVEKRSAAREARAADCHVDGRSIPDGNNFTRFTTGPCVVYKCNAGNIVPLKNGCYRDGQCYPEGDKYTLGCLERTCTTTNGRIDYELTREGCRAYDGLTCVNVGSTWTNACVTYRCSRIVHSEFSISYHMDQVAWGCQLDNECVPENHTITQDCRVEQCQRHFSAIGFYTLKLGCPLSGECLEIGGSKTIDCTTLTCQREDFEGIHYVSVRPTKIQCEDADKMCHESGSYFPIETNGRRLNCTCIVHEGFLGVGYTCPPQ